MPASDLPTRTTHLGVFSFIEPEDEMALHIQKVSTLKKEHTDYLLD